MITNQFIRGNKADLDISLKDRITVLHVITDLETGGAEMMLYKLLSCTDRTRFNPIVLSLMNRGTLVESIKTLNIPIYTLGMQRAEVTVTAILKLRRVIFETAPDVIQGWMYHGNIAAQLTNLLALRTTPIIWNIRNCIDFQREKNSTSLLIRASSPISYLTQFVIYNSHVSAAQHEEIGYSAKKTTIISNGFTPDVFRPSKYSYNDVRYELNLTPETILIGRIGRYHPIKDHPNFLKAAQLLRSHSPNVQFVMAGPGLDWDNPELTALVQKYSLSDCLHLLGDRRDTPRLNAAFDIACSSSSHGEAFPNIIGEAMSCAVPCVVTDVGDSAEIVADTGIVVPPSCPNQLAQALRFMLSQTKEERAKLGSAARQRVIDHYSLDAITNQYERLYKSVVTKLHLIHS